MSEFKIPMQSDGRSLKPFGDIAIEDFEKVRRDKPVVVTINEARNVEHLRKYWAVAQKVADHCDAFHDRYDADWYARASMHWMVREIIMSDGRVALRPKSIAIESMSQKAFERFYDRALHIWALRIGCDPEELE